MTKRKLNPYIRDEAETLAPSEMRQLQLDRLSHGIDRVCKESAFYKQRLGEMELGPGDIRSLDDLPRLPFTTKDDLRDHYPFGLLAVPMKDVVRVHASSGTTGKPTVVAYTRADLDLWSDLMTRAFGAAGVTAEDVVHNAYGYGLFTGGLGFHYGAERLGAAVIPASGGNTRRQLMLLRDFGGTVLCSTPSYAMLLAEQAAETGLDIDSLALRAGLFGAEPWSERMREEIESRLGILALNVYGLSEIIGPGVSVECHKKQGMHIFEDHFIPEIIDPDTGEPLPDGEIGELVLTCLTKQAMPLIRYCTRDRTRLMRERCGCGRTTVRMERVLGRTDDMIIVRGVNVFPSQIEAALLTVDAVEPHYQIIVDRNSSYTDELEVRVETPGHIFGSSDRMLHLEARLAQEVHSALGISCKISLAAPKEIERSEGKAVRVVDRRSL